MAYKVVMTRAAYPGLPRDLDTYRSLGAQFSSVGCRNEEEIIAAARDADVIISAMQPITRRVIEKLERCRLICLIGIGYEGVDLQAATEHGILVANVPDYCQEEVSDHTMALLLACARKLFPVMDAVRAGKWDSMEKLEIRTKVWPPMFRLRGQTLGIVGLGRIGRAVVPKAQGFGLKVIAYSRSPVGKDAQTAGVERVSLERLLAESDYVSLHCNLTRENRHLIGREQFGRMKPAAYLINTARGALVDEAALCEALTQGLIAGAALDV
ncbi:MAG: C-terminal binding protein, partial [Chloroflexota bacterium]|nr:C-terminal binding protein [Chloroflexota bacterium]